MSELTSRSSAEKITFKQTEGVWVFDLPVDTPKATEAQVKELLSDGD